RLRFSAHSTRWQEPVTSRSAPWKESFTAMSSRAQIERLAAGAVPIEDAVPDLAGAFREPEQLAVFGVDGAFVDQKIEVDGAAPIAFADQQPELARDLVIMALGENALGDREPPGDCFLARSGGLRRAQGFHVPARRPRLANSRAAEHHDRVADTVLVEQGFRFEVFELQPQAAGLVAAQEFGIRLGQTVGRTLQNPLHPLQRLGILLG